MQRLGCQRGACCAFEGATLCTADRRDRSRLAGRAAPPAKSVDKEARAELGCEAVAEDDSAASLMNSSISCSAASRWPQPSAQAVPQRMATAAAAAVAAGVGDASRDEMLMSVAVGIRQVGQG